MATKTPKDLLSLIKEVDALPLNEQKMLAEKLLKVLSAPAGAARLFDGEDISAFSSGDAVSCPYCNKDKVAKWGFMKDHVTRRYRCSDCGRTFCRTTNSVISHTHKDASVWEEFILLVIKGTPLETCAKRCGISVVTAFSWRHKIMAAIADDQHAKMLSGIVA